jgi:4-amino-4-deoxy-L-arabinose transferase-like glycosyltransferase
MILLHSKKRLLNAVIILVFGIIIFILGLGNTGLVDETPPLFAAAARAMS